MALEFTKLSKKDDPSMDDEILHMLCLSSAKHMHEYLEAHSESLNPDDLDKFFAEAEVINSSDVEQKELPLLTNPSVSLIDPCNWQAFVDHIRSNKRENQKLIDIAARIENAGGCVRSLQTLAQNWEALIEQFSDAFPNFMEVAELLRDYFALNSVGDKRIQFPPLLLVGEAGIGKTEAARWLANNMNVPFCMIDMASAQTGSALSGSERFWANTRVGQVFETLAYEAYANPIIMLDELDKVLGDSRYDPFSPLYTLLEPSSAKTFTDLSVGEFSINASHINWIATANTLSTIPKPIQSRFTVLDIKKPTIEQAKYIARNIYKRLLLDASWGRFFNSAIDESVIEALLPYSPRTMKIVIQRALGAAICDQRNYLICEDLVFPKSPGKNGIGFLAMQSS